jgi:putative peptidoglycan lipid II flippase
LSDRPRSRLARRLAATGTITIGTSAAISLVVRLMSLGSQGLMASRFGAGRQLDAFFIALIVPGLVAAPLASAIELAVAAPYARALAEEPDRAPAMARRLLLRSAMAGVVLAAAVTAAAPLLVHVSAPGAGAARQRLAVSLALILYPSVFPRLVTAAASGVLFGARRLQAPLIINAVNPLAIIGVLLVDHGRHPAALAGSALAGWVLEAVLVLAYASHTERIRRGDPGPSYRAAVAALRPLLVTFVVLQISPTIDQVFAARIGAGQLVTFVIATRLFDGLVAMLVLPGARLAQVAFARAADERAALREELRSQLRRALVVGTAGALLLAAAAPVLILVVYRHGNFTSHEAWRAIAVTEVFAAALLPLAVGYVLPRALIALGQNGTMLRLMALQVVLNLVLDAVLVVPLGAVGIALATLASYAIVDAAQWLRLRDLLTSGSSGRATAGTSAAPTEQAPPPSAPPPSGP